MLTNFVGNSFIMSAVSSYCSQNGCEASYNPEENVVVKKINKHLMMGTAEGVQLLTAFLDTCSDTVFSENCVKWLQQCCKVEGKNKKDISSSLVMFSTLIKLSRKFPELGRPIANSVAGNFIDAFIKHLTGIQAGWEALQVLMTFYNNSLAASKERLEKLFNETCLDSQKLALSHQSRCLALLPTMGGGGTGGVTYKTNWRHQMDSLITACESILKSFAKSVSDIQVQSSSTQSDYGSFHDSVVRLNNTCLVMQSMLLIQYPTEKCVPAQALFSLVRLGVSIVERENDRLRDILLQVHTIMLKTLTALIVSCERALLPFSTVLVKLLAQELEFSEKLPELRAVVYCTLCNWIVVTKTGSCVNRIAKNIIEAVLLDIQTKRSVVILKGKGKRKKREATRSQLSLPFNEPLCFVALKLLDILVNSVGFMLPPDLHKGVQQVVVEILLSVKKCGPTTPLYGESPRCRAALFQVLLQLCLEPCTRWPPPTQYALQLLNYGQNDASPQVSSVCSAALTMIDRIIHPEFTVAAFPVDYNETVQDMKRLTEKEVEEAEDEPASPLSVISSLDHSSESETEIIDNQAEISPVADFTKTSPEINGATTIDATRPTNEQIHQQTVTDVELLEPIVSSPVCEDSSTTTTSSQEVPSEKTQFETLPCLVRRESSVDKLAMGGKRSVRSSCSDSDSLSSPPKRFVSEHSYNLRPKTPKRSIDSPVVHSSKTRRGHVTPAASKSSENDSNDTDDVTVLFDETIID